MIRIDLRTGPLGRSLACKVIENRAPIDHGNCVRKLEQGLRSRMLPAYEPANIDEFLGLVEIEGRCDDICCASIDQG